MIVNFYIETPNKSHDTYEIIQLKRLLIENGYKIYDATEFDSLTSGFHKLDSLEEIECEIEGK